VGEEVDCGKNVKCSKHDTKKQSTVVNECNVSRAMEESMSLEERPAGIVKNKYKNSKFNILLDMIH
jgi:hypothetical protein